MKLEQIRLSSLIKQKDKYDVLETIAGVDISWINDTEGIVCNCSTEMKL